jgi:charged multivesicular body protein 3
MQNRPPPFPRARPRAADIQFEEKKVRKSITEAAKRGDLATCKVLAKEVVQSRRAVSRLYVNKAQMISIGNALSEQLAMVRVAGTLQRSGEVMKLVNESLRMPELQRTMMEMSRGACVFWGRGHALLCC